MSKRSAEVELKLHAAQFKAEVRASKRDTESLDRSVEELDRDLKKLPPDAARAAAALKLLGSESGASRVKLEDLGRRSTVVGDLEHRLAGARSEARRLAEEFNRTGSIDAFSGWRRALDDVRGLERLQKDLTGAIRTGVSKGASSGFSDAAGSAGQYLVPVIAGAIIAGAPLLGGALSAAIGGAGAATGLAVAIAVAARDPQVQSAWRNLATDALDQLGAATAGFRNELITDADLARAAWNRILPGFAASANNLLPVLRHLVTGGLGAAENSASGLEKALAAGGRVMDQLATELPTLGKSLGDSLAIMAGDGQSAAVAVHDVVVVVEQLARAAAVTVNVLARVNMHLTYIAQGRFGDVFRDLTHAAQDVFGDGFDARIKAVGAGLADTSHQAELTTDQLSDLATQMNKATLSADSLAGAMTAKVLQSLIGMDQAVLGVAEAQTRLSQALKENGKQLDIHTAKGQANREAVLGVVTANIQQYQAMIASGASAKEAADAYDTNTAALERQLRKAGLTQKQIDGLIGKYKGVPAKIDTAIAINGLTEAINDLSDLIRQLNGLPKTKVINVKYSIPPPPGSPTVPGGGNRSNGNSRYAAGGLPAVGRPYWVGENGPELRLDYLPGRILSHSDSMAAVRSGIGAGRPAPSVINLHATFIDGATGDVLYRRLITYASNTGQAPADLWPDQRR